MKSYTTCKVVTALFRNEIHVIVAEKTSANPGERDWLKHHPAAVTQVMNGLNKEEMAEMEATRDEWNSEGPDQEEKQRYVIASEDTSSH